MKYIYVGWFLLEPQQNKSYVEMCFVLFVLGKYITTAIAQRESYMFDQMLNTDQCLCVIHCIYLVRPEKIDTEIMAHVKKSTFQRDYRSYIPTIMFHINTEKRTKHNINNS